MRIFYFTISFLFIPHFLFARQECPIPKEVLEYFNYVEKGAYPFKPYKPDYNRNIYLGKHPELTHKDQRILVSKDSQWELDLKKPFAIIHETKEFVLVEAKSGHSIRKKMRPIEGSCRLYVIKKTNGTIVLNRKLKKRIYLGYVLDDIFYYQFENKKKTHCIVISSKNIE